MATLSPTSVEGQQLVQKSLGAGIMSFLMLTASVIILHPTSTLSFTPQLNQNLHLDSSSRPYHCQNQNQNQHQRQRQHQHQHHSAKLIGGQPSRKQHLQKILMASGNDEGAPKKKAKKKAKKATKKTTKKKAKKATSKVSIDMADSTVVDVTPSPPIGKFAPSRVVDDDEPTPEIEDTELETLEDIDIPELHYDADDVAMPHQPWRRGDTDGCEDPISAPWRIEGEDIIRSAALTVGGEVTDVTWYMAALVITVNDDTLHEVEGEAGPEVRVYDDVEPMWFDPDDPEPEDDYGIYEGEEDGRSDEENEDGSLSSGIPNDPYLEREFDEATGTYMPPPKRPTREEAVRNIQREDFDKWVNDGMKVELSDRDERISKHKMSMEDFQQKLEELREATNMSEEEIETRAKDLRAWYLRSEDLAEYYPEEFQNVGNEEAMGEKLAMPVLERADGVKTDAVSTIARAIIEALEDQDVEDRLAILSRHEIIMTSPGPENYIETQRAFDQNREKIVNVQTQDPFGSNRVLIGTLVDRNALDIYINIEGRLVTIPLNMVAHVTISDENPIASQDEQMATA